MDISDRVFVYAIIGSCAFVLSLACVFVITLAIKRVKTRRAFQSTVDWMIALAVFLLFVSIASFFQVGL